MCARMCNSWMGNEIFITSTWAQLAWWNACCLCRCYEPMRSAIADATRYKTIEKLQATVVNWRRAACFLCSARMLMPRTGWNSGRNVWGTRDRTNGFWGNHCRLFLTELGSDGNCSWIQAVRVAIAFETEILHQKSRQPYESHDSFSTEGAWNWTRWCRHLGCHTACWGKRERASRAEFMTTTWRTRGSKFGWPKKEEFILSINHQANVVLAVSGHCWGDIKLCNHRKESKWNK